MKELGTKTLETERLILRKYKIEDAKGMYENWEATRTVIYIFLGNYTKM